MTNKGRGFGHHPRMLYLEECQKINLFINSLDPANAMTPLVTTSWSFSPVVLPFSFLLNPHHFPKQTHTKLVFNFVTKSPPKIDPVPKQNHSELFRTADSLIVIILNHLLSIFSASPIHHDFSVGALRRINVSAHIPHNCSERRIAFKQRRSKSAHLSLKSIRACDKVSQFTIGRNCMK